MASRSARGGLPVKLVVNVDGGARGNPGPAAIGAVVRDAAGEVLDERGERIGTATNNVAEYRALLLGIERAAQLGASELELIGDSELIVRQVKGEYKVKDATMRELHTEVKRALRPFERWSIRHVRREHNADADRLVNAALDG
jgi:ribonuclease HI